jgi:hypothetical protein
VVLLRARHLNAAVLRLRPEAVPLDSRVAPLAVGEPTRASRLLALEVWGGVFVCAAPGFVAVAMPVCCWGGRSCCWGRCSGCWGVLVVDVAGVVLVER